MMESYIKFEFFKVIRRMSFEWQAAFIVVDLLSVPRFRCVAHVKPDQPETPQNNKCRVIYQNLGINIGVSSFHF